MDCLKFAAENLRESSSRAWQPLQVDNLFPVAPVPISEGSAHISTDSRDFEIPAIRKCSDTWTCWSCKASGNTGRVCGSCGKTG